MQYGTVKMYDSTKGFGFIESDDNEDFFVHVNDLRASVPGQKLASGQRVAFDVRREIKGDKAVNVRLER